MYTKMNSRKPISNLEIIKNKIAEQEIEAGQKKGLWTHYDNNGEKQKESLFVSDEKKVVSYYKIGNINKNTLNKIVQATEGDVKYTNRSGGLSSIYN